MSTVERWLLVAASADLMAEHIRDPLTEHDTTAVDDAARALVLALDGPPAPTTVLNLNEIMMTREFDIAFKAYWRANGPRLHRW